MASLPSYDVIIAGSGSIGTPTAFFMAQSGLKVLVIDPLPSNGQASNKHAIGGIRATHSDPSKIMLCTESLRVFSTWQETHGDDLEWRQGGYSFVAYEPGVEKTLKDLLAIQRSLGLNIHWLEREELLDLVPDINPLGLRGGTYSPEDGSASPLKASYAFYVRAKQLGAEFHFNEKIVDVETQAGCVNRVITNRGNYPCKYFVNAAGSWAAEVSELLAVSIPVRPDAHEAGITEAVQPMFAPMIVDIRERPGSANFYFYQHPAGKIIFCVTPSPQIWGFHDQDTSAFLPLACQRLVEIMPKLGNLRVRRTWRGTYPMTPDGNPLLGPVDEVGGYLLAAGMCGQGFMLGPGVGIILTHLVTGNLTEQERVCLQSLHYKRDFSGLEKLK